MKISAFLSMMACATLMTGCATNQHVYSADGSCLTCWNNPITGKPINYEEKKQENADQGAKVAESTPTPAPVTSTTKASKPTERKMSFTVPINVDIAYLKIKKEFSYQSSDEVRQEFGSLASTKMASFEYHYDVMPSLFYHMRDTRRHDGIPAVIDSRIEKKSEKESEITVTYWLNNTSVNPDQFGQSLKSRFTQALNI